jgi:hypothetical protein
MEKAKMESNTIQQRDCLAFMDEVSITRGLGANRTERQRRCGSDTVFIACSRDRKTANRRRTFEGTIINFRRFIILEWRTTRRSGAAFTDIDFTPPTSTPTSPVAPPPN